MSGLDQIVAEGRAARENGIDIRQNPYGALTIAGFCWDQGWCSVHEVPEKTTSTSSANVQRRLRINEIRHKLPPEGQKWLRGMDKGELAGTEGILNNVGEEKFLRCWQEYQHELQYVRVFGVSFLPEPRRPPARTARQHARR